MLIAAETALREYRRSVAYIAAEAAPTVFVSIVGTALAAIKVTHL